MRIFNRSFKIITGPMRRVVLSLIAIVAVVGLIFFRHAYSEYNPQRGWVDVSH